MKRLPFFTTIVLFSACSSLAVAQQGRTNTAAGTAGSGGLEANAAAAGTTEGIGGVTTQGIGNAGNANGAEAGANAARGFIGGGNTDAFVGGVLESTLNSTINRQFRALQNTNVPSGSNQQKSGNARQVPVSFSIGFNYPRPTESTSLAGAGGVSVVQFANLRPELRSVQVNVSTEGVALLTGSVPNQSAKRLAGNLVRIEPGVKTVSNRLLISAASSQPAE